MNSTPSSTLATDTNPRNEVELAITQYEVGEIEADSTSVEVVYTNDEGLIYKRSVNIPRNSDGSVNQEYFDQILQGQLMGVNNKLKVGVAVFVDPNAVEDGAAPPEEVEEPDEEVEDEYHEEEEADEEEVEE